MIKDIAQQLLQDDDILCGESVNPRFLEECRQYLMDMKYCDVPGEYLTLLRYVNSVRSENAILLGVLPGDELNDIVAVNERYQLGGKQLVLGQTDLDILVYHAESGDYQVRNHQDLSLAEVFDSLEEALSYWFSLKEQK
ncbi:MAG: hypothetical protein OSJ76_09055 [Alphaproteobacteria bacterium]|nr:hypothetical protein [Alphaproteobacteria bacterium]